MQEQVFDVIGLSPEQAKSQFGFLLEAFRYGAPPHGGIAFGWDRTLMLLAGRDTIRDVIAFPKAASGLDPLTGAPTPITPPSAGKRESTRSPPEASRTRTESAPASATAAGARRLSWEIRSGRGKNGG